MNSFVKFISYHNAVPIGLFVLFGVTGGVFAASPEARELMFNAVHEVRSVDNTYIAGKNLDAYTPRVVITGVSEDEEFYYVIYRFTTIDLVDYVWQDVEKLETMKVSKKELGPHLDLGLFVTKQLKQLIDRELAYLKSVQEFERRSVTHKQVATVYSGLIGRFLDATTETLPGYTPVVEPPPPSPKPDPVLSLPGEPQPQRPQPQPQSEPPGEGAGETKDTTPPLLQVLGDNPARVPVGVVYTDLGAAATDDSNENLTIKFYVNGTRVAAVVIDTSAPGEWMVRYEAQDSAGNIGVADRRVEVYDPNAQTGGGSGGGSGGESATTEPLSGTTMPSELPTSATTQPEPPTATTTLPEPEPAPEPESESAASPEVPADSDGGSGGGT